jgi:predicted DNA-binding transcriptional regulator YafY
MDRTERINLLHSLLTHNRYGLSTERLMQEARCSRATLYRDLGFMRDTLGAPVEHEEDPSSKWRYVGGAGNFQLPGVWLTADELYALTLAQQLLQRVGGLLGKALGPLLPRIQKLLGDKARRLGRLRVLRTQARPCDPNVFRTSPMPCSKAANFASTTKPARPRTRARAASPRSASSPGPRHSLGRSSA